MLPRILSTTRRGLPSIRAIFGVSVVEGEVQVKQLAVASVEA